VVSRALGAGTAESAARALAALPPRATNPFGLLVADAEAAFRVDYGEVRPLAPGIAILANWGPDQRMPRLDRAAALAAAVPPESFAGALPAIERLLADHEGAEVPGQAICVHGEHYATVSSTIVAAGAGGARWRDATGNPCRGGWVERDAGPPAADPGRISERSGMDHDEPS
jgi:hypothetical protein